MCIHVLSCAVVNFVRGFLTGAKIEIAVLLQTLLEDVLYHGAFLASTPALLLATQKRTKMLVFRVEL